MGTTLLSHRDHEDTVHTLKELGLNMITEIQGITTDARLDEQVCAVPRGY